VGGEATSHFICRFHSTCVIPLRLHPLPLVLQKVITELDEKKNEALRTTWVKVNKDFGSIFSTMLPGVTAKLDPPEGGSVLDGLEVKVAFHGVWKETLTELSGGQRSLLALSLILALLLFKPAPLYILDEVDAALDLSHTQNIGHMCVLTA
jgi:structural maintenance of chromosome 2